MMVFYSLVLFIPGFLLFSFFVFQKKNNHNEGGDGEKGPLTVVAKKNTNCGGCASEIVKYVGSFEGLETVKSEVAYDPKHSNNNNNNKTNQSKPDDGKPTEVQPPVTTAVLKMSLHCEGCIRKIKKLIPKFKGVMQMSIDEQNELITINGPVDVKAFTEYLKKKAKRRVEIVPPKKEKEYKESNDGGSTDDDNDNDNSGGGKNENKEGEGDGEGEGGNKAESSGGGGVKMICMGQAGIYYRYGYHMRTPVTVTPATLLQKPL